MSREPANENKRSRKPEVALMRSSSEKKGFMCLSFKGMGCKSVSLIDAKSQKRKKGVKNQAVNVHSGIGVSSHFPARNRNPVSRNDRHSREARRNGIEPRDDHRFGDDIIEIMMSQQTLHTGRNLLHYDHSLTQYDDIEYWFEGSFGRRDSSSHNSITSFHEWRLDPYQEWRLDVDEMSYEDLLDLGDKIGYVGTGLQEEDIPGCLGTKWRFNGDFAAPLPVNVCQKDWKCSICQEKYVRDNEIGMLGCGHHHHVDCIRQWLLKKNSCPICKCAAMQRKSG